MIVYSVNDRRSFDEVKVIKRTLDEIRKSRNVSCVIVGNKSDLDHDRRVTTAEGEGLAAEHACAFFETSACDGGAEIQEAFHELYREVRRRKILENKSRRRSSAAQVKNVLGKMFTKINSGWRSPLSGALQCACAIHIPRKPTSGYNEAVTSFSLLSGEGLVRLSDSL